MQNDVHTDWLVFYKYSENSIRYNKLRKLKRAKK